MLDTNNNFNAATKSTRLLNWRVGFAFQASLPRKTARGHICLFYGLVLNSLCCWFFFLLINSIGSTSIGKPSSKASALP